MIIPRRYPRQIRVRKLKVQITAIRSMSLPEVIERMNHTLRLRNSSNRPSIAIITLTFVFVNVVAQVNYIIHTILTDRVAVRVEEAERVVGTAVDSHVDLADMVVDGGSCFGSAEGAFDVAIADVELVVVSGERFKACCFDFDRIVDVAGSVGFAARDDVGKVVCEGNLVLNAYRSCGHGLDWAVIVERDVAGHDGVIIYRVILGRHSRPKDDGIGIWISRCYAVGEAEFGRLEAFLRRVALVHFVKSYAQARVVLRWRAVVDVLAGVSRLVRMYLAVVRAMGGDVPLSNWPRRTPQTQPTKKGETSCRATQYV